MADEKQSSRIWRTGFDAKKSGVPKSACPFAMGSLARRQWLAGYRAAEAGRPARKRAA